MAITHGTAVDTDVDHLAELRKQFIGGEEETSNEEMDAQVPESSEEPAAEPEAETEEQNTEASVESTPEQALDIETVWVKGAKGEKQKLDISYADKQKIKEAYLKAAGMRKFQQERDNYKKLHSEALKKHEELASNFSKLDEAFKNGGAKGVIELLGGGKGAWEQALEAEMKHREYIAGLSPEERLQLDMKEREKHFTAEKSKVEQEYKKLYDQVKQKEEAAAVRSLEAKFAPAFEKYRMSGKLGDTAAETKIDKLIWTEVTENLASLPDDVEITQAIIDKEFRTVSGSFKNFLTKQADTKLKQTVAKKKEDAAQRAQVAVKKGMIANNEESEMQKAIENNDWSKLMQMKLFGRK